jgi:hypothetical protein
MLLNTEKGELILKKGDEYSKRGMNTQKGE